MRLRFPGMRHLRRLPKSRVRRLRDPRHWCEDYEEELIDFLIGGDSDSTKDANK